MMSKPDLMDPGEIVMKSKPGLIHDCRSVHDCIEMSDVESESVEMMSKLRICDGNTEMVSKPGMEVQGNSKMTSRPKTRTGLD